MLLATTPILQGQEIDRHLGLVFGDVVLGVNVVKDLLGGLRDIVGGRSGTYEQELAAARDSALQGLVGQARALGAEAVIGIAVAYEVVGPNGGMLTVSASGTAVTLKGTAAPANP